MLLVDSLGIPIEHATPDAGVVTTVQRYLEWLKMDGKDRVFIAAVVWAQHALKTGVTAPIGDISSHLKSIVDEHPALDWTSDATLTSAPCFDDLTVKHVFGYGEGASDRPPATALQAYLSISELSGDPPVLIVWYKSTDKVLVVSGASGTHFWSTDVTEGIVYDISCPPLFGIPGAVERHGDDWAAIVVTHGKKVKKTKKKKTRPAAEIKKKAAPKKKRVKKAVKEPSPVPEEVAPVIEDEVEEVVVPPKEKQEEDEPDIMDLVDDDEEGEDDDGEGPTGLAAMVSRSRRRSARPRSTRKKK